MRTARFSGTMSSTACRSAPYRADWRYCSGFTGLSESPCPPQVIGQDIKSSQFLSRDLLYKVVVALTKAVNEHDAYFGERDHRFRFNVISESGGR